MYSHYLCVSTSFVNLEIEYLAAFFTKKLKLSPTGRLKTPVPKILSWIYSNTVKYKLYKDEPLFLIG